MEMVAACSSFIFFFFILHDGSLGRVPVTSLFLVCALFLLLVDTGGMGDGGGWVGGENLII